MSSPWEDRRDHVHSLRWHFSAESGLGGPGQISVSLGAVQLGLPGAWPDINPKLFPPISHHRFYCIDK